MHRVNQTPIRVAETAWLLERGYAAQITQLRVIKHLVENDREGRLFYSFLLKESFRLYSQGQSLTRIQLIAESYKTELYERALALLKALNENDGVLNHGKDAIDLHNEISAISSGWKRVSTRDLRRNMEDPDLVLIEQALRFSMNHWFTGDFAYFLSRYFVCDYARCRFVLSPDSSGRVLSIANYFSQKCLGSDINRAW
jgi:hypothetical protein